MFDLLVALRITSSFVRKYVQQWKQPPGLPSSSWDGFHYKATSTIQRVGFDDFAIFLDRGHRPIQHKLAQSYLPPRCGVKMLSMQIQRQMPLVNTFPQLCWQKDSCSLVLLEVLQ